jgi:hypothetical protein
MDSKRFSGKLRLDKINGKTLFSKLYILSQTSLAVAGTLYLQVVNAFFAALFITEAVFFPLRQKVSDNFRTQNIGVKSAKASISKLSNLGTSNSKSFVPFFFISKKKKD